MPRGFFFVSWYRYPPPRGLTGATYARGRVRGNATTLLELCCRRKVWYSVR